MKIKTKKIPTRNICTENPDSKKKVKNPDYEKYRIYEAKFVLEHISSKLGFLGNNQK